MIRANLWILALALGKTLLMTGLGPAWLLILAIGSPRGKRWLNTLREIQFRQNSIAVVAESSRNIESTIAAEAHASRASAA